MLKKFCGIGLAILAVVAGFALTQAFAAEEEGWVKLFNGKDLTGWKASENGKFTVEDGCIVVRGNRAHLFSEKEFKNFEAKVEIMTKPGSNSGFYIHTKYQESWPDQGYEVQVNCTHTDPVKNGSIYNVVKNYDPIAKDDEWYTLEVKVKGKNIVTKVNGKIVVDYTEPEGVTGPRKLSKGSFAIQAHDPKSEVRYRSVMVKELPD
jgi:hypothetical protein